MSQKYGSSDSKYFYSDSNTLINKLDIRDEQLLKEAEALYTAQRLLELQAKPIIANFDLENLIMIHKYIYQDLYEFAGTIRNENISKGQTFFASVPYIEPNAKKLFSQLRSENYLVGTTIDDFSEKAAYYMAELNIIHPFREGNGRAIREFIRCLAWKCGFALNWNAVTNSEILEASISSVNDITHLTNVIRRCIE